MALEGNEGETEKKTWEKAEAAFYDNELYVFPLTCGYRRLQIFEIEKFSERGMEEQHESARDAYRQIKRRKFSS